MAHVPPSNFYVELGRRVKARRTALRLTQEALASELGLQRTSIANLEKGIQRVSAEAVAILAAALRVSPALLMPEQTSSDSRLDDLIGKQVPSGIRPYLLSAAKTLK
jgi:transcriptional regulator with XRE-family HTH domain